MKFFAARTLAVLAVSAIVVFCTSDGRARAQSALGPTQHPALPASESDLWLVPAAADRTARANPTAQTLAAAVKLYDSGEYSTAQATLNRLPPSPALLDYVDYYKGLVQLRLKQYPEARRTLEALAGRKPVGAISLNTALALGETAEASGRLGDAIEIYRRIADDRHLVSDDVLSRLGAVAMSAGDRKTAAAAYLRVYYEFALSDLATAAASHLATLQDQIVKTGYQQDLGRAAMLFGARRYAEARTAFQEIQRQASGDDRELADLRVAECDFHLKRYDAARDGVRPYLDRASRKAEARFFHLSALRELGQHDEYVAQTRALVSDFAGDSWAEEALNNLGTHYILIDEDEAAARVFGELYEKFPTGPRAERAAWKYGWWSYRSGDYDKAVQDVRECRRGVSPLGLPAVVSVLGGARARQARARGHGRRSLPPGPPRLRQLVLRPSGAETRRSTSARAGRGRSGGLCLAAAGDEHRTTAANGGSHPSAPRQRPVRRGDLGAALRAAAVGHESRPSRRRLPGPTTRKGSCAGRLR